ANQLPDHLPVLLRLLVKLEEEELRRPLIAEILVPALDKMFKAFADGDNPYRDLIEVIYNALKSDLPARSISGQLESDELVPELYRISTPGRDEIGCATKLRNDHAEP